MLSRWILAFGMRREQPKTRCPKETVKPQLEELTQRILLSVSATPSPQMAETVMQMFTTMMEERAQLIVTVEQDLVNIFDTYTQRIAQEAASAVQQWEQFLGIVPPSSGSGSGSGTITTTNDSTNQQPVATQPKSGSGMGSGATTSHENPSKSGSMPMSGSCGSGSGPIPEVYFGSGSNPFPEEPPMCGTVVATRGVFLSETTCHPVTVYYTTVDGTATAGTDYTYTSGSLTIPAGQISAPQPIKITILDDGNDESGGTQYFDVELTGAQGATVGTPYVSEVDITEDPQEGVNDTLYWNPCSVQNTNSADPTNWYDDNLHMQLQKGAPGPGAGTPIIFDGTQNSAISKPTGIDWTKSVTVASITLQNKYFSTMTVEPGVVLASTSINDGGTSQLNMDFNASSNVLAIRGGTSSLTSFNLKGQTGNFELSGGTMTFRGLSTSYSIIDVYGGTTLNLAAGLSLSLDDGASLPISSGATVNVDGSGNQVRVTNDGTAGSIINNEGTININGTAGGNAIYFGIPVLNSGMLNIDGGGSALQAGSTLEISGQDALTNNSDLDMTAGSVNLSGAATLQLQHLYTQTGGTFQTTDNLAANLIINGTGNANVSGGNIQMGTNGEYAQYGELDVTCSVFNMSAELDIKVNGDQESQCDALSFKSSSKLNIQNGSTLKVTIIGGQPLQGNEYWVIRNAGQALNQFTTQNLSGLVVNTSQLKAGQYKLDQP